MINGFNSPLKTKVISSLFKALIASVKYLPLQEILNGKPLKEIKDKV